ncbi:class I SAM-dependent methyltransferase [Kribbella sp. NPDC050470]
MHVDFDRLEPLEPDERRLFALPAVLDGITRMAESLEAVGETPAVPYDVRPAPLSVGTVRRRRLRELQGQPNAQLPRHWVLAEGDPVPRERDCGDGSVAHSGGEEAVIVEIHVPLSGEGGILPGEAGYEFGWIDDVEEFLDDESSDGSFEIYDEGEEYGDTYVFFITGAGEDALLSTAVAVAALPGVPAGAFAVITDEESEEIGTGRRVALGGREALLAAWRAEEERVREGWDFSHLAGRVDAEDPPWDFETACRTALRGARHVLDMGTGGGERLLALADALPADVVATEGWEPNLPVATERLAVRGIPVVQYDADTDETMPFEDGRFDLVMNRHEVLDPAEVYRVLAPGGVFLTQQVGGDDFAEAHEIFGGTAAYLDLTLAYATQSLTAAGFVIDECDEWRGSMAFRDIGALTYYFKLVPWDVPDDFGVDRYAETLLRLHESVPVTFTQTRFWVRAVKPV